MTAAETNGRREPLGDESDEDTSEAQAQVIASLRAQVTDLFSQVTQLNSKLVSSYDRMSDLEDQLHDSSSSLRNASLTISSLELERSHHLAALNTGLLVEKAHVTAELNRLMERATEEAAQRGQAESARRDIEKDLDDLSASLFDQANTMVAEARLNQAKSERKVQDAEQALKIAEDAVKDMQVQMQVLQAEKETAEHGAREAKLTVRKGKWVERDDSPVEEVSRIRFMTAHTPYTEFIAFVAHLRGLKASQPIPPPVSTLLTQPFIARLLTEDSEPTVRLDLAPSLNWLSRRSVLSAIHSGMLTVEPLPFSSLAQELQQHSQSTSNSSVSCALCGTLITRLPSASPISRTHSTNGSSWFRYPLALSPTQNHNAGAPQPEHCQPPGQVYIFRLSAAAASAPPPSLTPVHSSASTSAAGASSRPPLNAISSSRVLQTQTHNSSYPLCTSNYCLMRLRSTCSLWAFVRVGVIERVWEEVVPTSKSLVNGENKGTRSPLTTSGAGNPSANNTNSLSVSEKPPVPPRRRRLWEMASALGEKAANWGRESGENTNEKEKEIEKDGTKKLPTPPPSHPSVPHPHTEPPTSKVHVQDPPPLPKRSATRGGATADSPAPPSSTQNGVKEIKASASDANGHNDLEKADTVTSTSAPLDEIAFAAPPSEASPPPTPLPTATEPSTPRTQDHPRSSSPHTIPLPVIPTTSNPVSRVSSPTPRPRSQHSSPASPPPNSRSVSPTINRSRAGSPAPSGIARVASPSPGQPPFIPHVRGKVPLSPLGPSRSASPAPAIGPGAPPLPRRAAARRAVPPPPTLGNLKVAEEVGKEEAGSSVADPTREPDACKASEVEVLTEKKSYDDERDGNPMKGEAVPSPGSVSTATTEATQGPASHVAVDAANLPRGDVEGVANGTSAAVTSEPLPPSASEGDDRTSMDTTSTKQSSSTEGRGFATDTTWEERTWKELIRLKEDMFWARIGGIRAHQG